MVQFIPISPEEIDEINLRMGHRGRISYPILKQFMETGQAMVQLDREGMTQSLQNLTSTMNAYIKSHKMPIKLFTRKGEIYLARTDINSLGEKIIIEPIIVTNLNDKIAARK